MNITKQILSRSQMLFISQLGKPTIPSIPTYEIPFQAPLEKISTTIDKATTKIFPAGILGVITQYVSLLDPRFVQFVKINLTDLIKPNFVMPNEVGNINNTFAQAFRKGVKLTLQNNDDAFKNVMNRLDSGSVLVHKTPHTILSKEGVSLIVAFGEQRETWLPPLLKHTENQIIKFEWANWLPVKLVKPSIFVYLSNKVIKFIDNYSNSKDISEAGEKFVNSLGTVDKNGIVIPKIQHKLLDLAKNYISDSQLLGKAIVEATDILFATVKPYDSLVHTAHTIVTSLIGQGTASSSPPTDDLDMSVLA